MGIKIDPNELLTINNIFQKQLGIEALRPEAKIYFILKSRGELSIKEAMLLSGVSYRGFYLVLARLIEKGLVKVQGDQQDKRVKKIVIDNNRALNDDFSFANSASEKPTPLMHRDIRPVAQYRA